MSSEFIWPIRVYYEDTDAGGVVFYANYLKFFERARSEWLNHLGIDQAELLADDRAFAVTKADVDYRKPARLNDELEIVTQVVELAGASLTFRQQLFFRRDRHTRHEQQLICDALIKVVCLRLSTFTPCRLPVSVKKEIQRAS